jgi:hypothetical protein
VESEPAGRDITVDGTRYRITRSSHPVDLDPVTPDSAYNTYEPSHGLNMQVSYNHRGETPVVTTSPLSGVRENVVAVPPPRSPMDLDLVAPDSTYNTDEPSPRLNMPVSYDNRGETPVVTISPSSGAREHVAAAPPPREEDKEEEGMVENTETGSGNMVIAYGI